MVFKEDNWVECEGCQAGGDPETMRSGLCAECWRVDQATDENDAGLSPVWLKNEEIRVIRKALHQVHGDDRNIYTLLHRELCRALLAPPVFNESARR